MTGSNCKAQGACTHEEENILVAQDHQGTIKWQRLPPTLLIPSSTLVAELYRMQPGLGSSSLFEHYGLSKLLESPES